MKRLLSLVAFVALVASVMPGDGIAAFRGAYDPITRTDLPAADGVLFGNGLANGIQTPAVRPRPLSNLDGIPLMERWITFTTRSQAVGHETSREIWQFYDRSQQALLVATIAEARSPILRDPTGVVSYIDPAWSPDGRFLAYVETNAQITSSALMIQQYAASTSMATSITPIGAPVTVIPAMPGQRPRHPDWSPDGLRLVYDSDASGTSIDIYTIQIFASPADIATPTFTIGTPVQHTFVGNRAEQNPAWAPDGIRVAYDTNRFGPNVIEIVDTNTNAVSLAETNFAQVAHANPDWSSDGNSIYYDAPGGEDSQQNQDIWKLDLPSQSKCAIQMDGAGDVNVAVSPTTNFTPDGLPYNNIWYESQGLGFGLIVWRNNPVQSCYAPLPMAIEFKPQTMNFDDNTTGNEKLGAVMSFPPEVQAAGYIMNQANLQGREGVRLRTSVVRSPTMMGLTPLIHPQLGAPFPDFTESNGSETITTYWSRRTVQARLVALGLVNQQVPVQVDAYSNRVGRRFRGFGLLKIAASSLAGSAVKLEQNSPNPFNPVTRIKFAVSKDSNVALRIYNVQGQLVKTLVNERMGQGMHEVGWDGRDSNGGHVSSGVYYAKVTSDGGSTDVIKMVMAK